MPTVLLCACGFWLCTTTLWTYPAYRQLQALNSAVAVAEEHGPVTEKLLSMYSMVVFTEGALADMLRFNAYCRANGIGFVMVHTRGLCGHAFVDFGDEFTVRSCASVCHCVELCVEKCVCVCV